MFIFERPAGFLEVSATVKLCGQHLPSLDRLPPDMHSAISNIPRNDVLVKGCIYKKGERPWI